MSNEVLEEEFEVLESIYPEELTKLSEREIQIVVEPEGSIDGVETVKAYLKVHYPDDYPDSMPELSLDPFEGTLDEDEIQTLLDGLKAVGENSLGLAMTFTFVSELRELLFSLVSIRAERLKREGDERERIHVEEEEAKTRGTPVTAASFAEWNAKYLKELARSKILQDEEKLKGLSPKERDEYKKVATRLTGRQLFEKDRNLATSDSSLLEEDTVSVDISQYVRTRGDPIEEEEEERITFSDSDSD